MIFSSKKLPNRQIPEELDELIRDAAMYSLGHFEYRFCGIGLYAPLPTQNLPAALNGEDVHFCRFYPHYARVVTFR